MGAKGSSADGKRSREKGFRFEINMAKKFQAWWQTPVKRVPLSGAYGAEWGLAGDLMFGRSWLPEALAELADVPPEMINKPPPFPYYVELKKRESWKLEHLLTSDKGPVKDWWVTAVSEAEIARQRPLLIVARNRVDPLVVMRAQDLPGPAMFPHVSRRDWVPSRSRVLVFRLEHLLTPVMSSMVRDLPALEPHTEVDFR